MKRLGYVKYNVNFLTVQNKIHRFTITIRESVIFN